ncbi:MAG: 4-hydroxybenzoate octaprenyltransferase [Gammaproteobacteria bacterium]
MPLKFKQYALLMRIDKPIGTWLFLWPAWWGLWLASHGQPALTLWVIFALGAFLMRSAGCVINDIADRNIDGFVARTKNRPLASKQVTLREAFILFILLCLSALVLTYWLNSFARLLSIYVLLLAVIYPFMKRFTHVPQLILGLACNWSVIMAYAAQSNELPLVAWLLYTAAVMWTVAYDTMYAMSDREDDIKIGIKSTAILFGQYDRLCVGLLQLIVIVLLGMCGYLYNLRISFYIGLAAASGFFIYQQWLIKNTDRQQCFKAFLNNKWFGLMVLISFVVGMR